MFCSSIFNIIILRQKMQWGHKLNCSVMGEGMVINDNGMELLSVSGMSNKTAPYHSTVILVEYSKPWFAELSGIRRNINEF